MIWIIALLPLWLWGSLVFVDRSGQFAIFGPFVLTLAVIATVADKLSEALIDIIAATGEW